jgi:hypothetical protein
VIGVIGVRNQYLIKYGKTHKMGYLKYLGYLIHIKYGPKYGTV